MSTRGEYGLSLTRRRGREQVVEVLWLCLKHFRQRNDAAQAELLIEGDLVGISTCYDAGDRKCPDCQASIDSWEQNAREREGHLRALIADPRTEWQLVEVDSHALTFKLCSVADLDGHVHDIVPEEHRARLAGFEVLVRVSVTTHGPRAEEPVWR